MGAIHNKFGLILFTAMFLFTGNSIVSSAFAQADDEEETRADSPIYTRGSILHGSGQGSSPDHSAQKVQIAIVESLRSGDYVRAKKLLTTPGGRALQEMAPDYEDRVNQYIKAAMQQEMMAARYVNVEDLQNIMSGQLFQIAYIGNTAVKQIMVQQLSKENVQERIQEALKNQLQEQIREIAKVAMSDERKAELEALVKGHFDKLGKEGLEKMIRQRFENMSDLEKEQYLKKHINKVVKQRVRDSLKEELAKQQSEDFKGDLKNTLHSVVKPVAEGINKHNVQLVTKAMMDNDGKLAYLFESLDKEQSAKIFEVFSEEQLARFVSMLNLQQSTLAAKQDLAKSVAHADPKALEMLVKGLDKAERDQFMGALIRADLTSYIENTFNEHVKKALLERLSKKN